MSMSGSLVPSVPEQLLLKYSPPQITLVYHFEKDKSQKFFHEIFLEKRMLESQSDEEICSFLYMSEAYYFNPKQLKR